MSLNQKTMIISICQRIVINYSFLIMLYKMAYFLQLKIIFNWKVILLTMTEVLKRCKEQHICIF